MDDQLADELAEANTALEDREFRRAYDVAIGILEQDDENAAALSVVFASLMGMEERKTALAVADRIVALAPGDWRSHIARAHALIATNKRRDAVTVAARAAELAPSDSDAVLAFANVAKQVLGKADIARRAARRALQLDPLSVAAQRTLGDIEGIQHNWDGAIEAYAEALRMDSTDGLTLMRMAGAQRRLGHRREANRVYEKLAIVEPELLEDPVAQPNRVTPAALVRGFADVRRALAALVSAFLATILVVAVVVGLKPTLFLGSLLVAVVGFTAHEPSRRWLARRVAPRALARAQTRTSWPGRNPDVVVGVMIASSLLALVLVSLFSS